MTCRTAWARLALPFVALVLTWASSVSPALAQPAESHPEAQASSGGPSCEVARDQPERVLSGIVADAQDARVSGATVIAQCGDFTRRAQSDADGTFALRVPAGTYTVRVEGAGFGVFTQQVTVAPERDTEMAVALSVAQLTDSVTVSAPMVEAERRASTATKTDTPLIETPQSVTVISAAQMRDQASPNLQEAVRYTAGVRNELYGIDNRGDWISLRGSEESTTLLDGMRLPLTGWYGVVRVEPYAYDRIEVLRGPSSIIAGQNDPGGVVNLASKRPRAEAAREVGVRFGNYNRRELQFDMTGPLSADGTWLYRLVAVGKDSDTQIDHADERRALVAPSLTWRPDARRSVTLYGDYQYDRSKNTNAFLGLAGTLDPAPNGPIPRDLFVGEPDWDRYGGSRRRVGYETGFALGGAWQLRHNLRYDRVNGVMKSMYLSWYEGFFDEIGEPDDNGRYMGRQWYVYDDRSRVTTTEALLQGVVRTGAIRHTLLVGVDGMVHDASQASSDGIAPLLDVYAPAYGLMAEPSLAGGPPTETEVRRLGLLAQDQMKFFDRVSLRLGVRRDVVRNEVVGGEIDTDWATSTNVGLVYEVVPGLAPYVSYSESFNPITGTDAAGRAFEPKRGEQVEGGLKWESPSMPVQATAAVYSLKEKNRLANDPVNVGYSVQLGEARIRGVELEAKGDVASWSVLGSYTYTRARASAAAWGGDLDPDHQIEGVPEHTASAWAVHDLGRLGLVGLRLGGGVRRIGRIGDGTGAVFVPAVTLLDAMGAYDSGPWRFALNLNNVADKSYIATCLGRGDCWFGQRRTLSLTAAYRY